jgi:hypothetical protein
MSKYQEARTEVLLKNPSRVERETYLSVDAGQPNFVVPKKVTSMKCSTFAALAVNITSKGEPASALSLCTYDATQIPLSILNYYHASNMEAFFA